jgi:phthiodiolone/phenolphthiodiolone dimycocerosates ketoreductase
LGISTGFQLPASPPLALLRALVVLARIARLESILVPDHLQGFIPSALWEPRFSWLAARYPHPHAAYDYQVLLGYLAAHAGRLRLGVGVTEAIRRHPVLLAQAAVTLAHATKRAPILGIGAGERENLEPYGLPFEQPVGVLEEALQIVRRCLDGRGPIDFQGKHFRLDGALMDLPVPSGRRPDLWVAAHGPRMLRLTGTYGDGWYPTVVASPQEYATKLAAIRAAAATAGRAPDAVTPALHQYVVVAPTEREARAVLQTRAGRWAALLAAPPDAWHAVGAQHPFGDSFRGYVDVVPERYDRATLERALAAVPHELLGHGLVVGTPDQVTERLLQFARAGMRHVVLDLASALASPRLALYGLLVLPRIARSLRAGALLQSPA